jgi:hypothetical protein
MQETDTKRSVGRPYEGGRTTQVVRIPLGWDKQKLIDIYILVHAHLDGRREGILSGKQSCGRDWTQYDRLMQEIAAIIDTEEV